MKSNLLKFSLICFAFLLLWSCKDGVTPPPPTQAAQQTPVENQVAEPNLEERTSWQKPQLIISQLGNIADKTIADIGAGTGYFTFQLMRKAKTVIAVEIDQNMIALMEAFASTLGDEMRNKIDIRLAEPDDPKLKPKEVDIALFVNVVPYVENRTDYFKNLKSVLPPGGKVVIVDFKVRRLPIDAPPYDERVLPYIIEEELFSAGFTKVKVDDSTLDFQYLITAE